MCVLCANSTVPTAPGMVQQLSEVSSFEPEAIYDVLDMVSWTKLGPERKQVFSNNTYICVSIKKMTKWFLLEWM